MNDATKYIRKIRNTLKRDYAERYRDFLLGRGKLDAEPEYEPLSYMAAQAVRIQLNKLVKAD